MLYLVLIGFISILGQAVLLRELSVASYGIELIYALALGVWLALSGAGALIRRRSLSPSPRSVSFLLFAFSLLLPAAVAFVRASRLLFGGIQGAYLPFQTQVLAMVLALLPLGLLSGLIFQRAAKLFIAGGHSLATAYGVESLGGLLGGLAATISLVAGVQNLTLGLLCSLSALAVCLCHPEARMHRWLRLAAAAAASCLLVLVWNSTALDRLMTSWTHPGLVETRDSPYCRVTVTKRLGQVSVFENDALSFETEGTAAEEFVHLAALEHPRPDRILILGGGIEGNIKEAAEHSPERIDYVEINPVLLEIAVPHLPADLQQSLHAESVQTEVFDPRQFLGSAEGYDLILIGMPEPTSGQANRFYTREFFLQCAARLNPGGIVAFRLRSSENFWTPQLARRTTSIYRALKSALRDVLILPGGTNIFIASDAELSRQPETLAARLSERGVRARLVSPPYLEYLLTNDRFHQIKEIVTTESAPVNTDARPICYQYTLMIWLSKFYPGLAALDLSLLPARAAVGSPLPWALALGLAGIFALARRSLPLRRFLLMFVVGFSGMVLETVVILNYQVKSGVLFRDIGILLMSFMAGTALGALFLGERLRIPVVRRVRLSSLGKGFLGCSALLSAAVAFRLETGSAGSLVEASLALLAAGFIVAAVFGYAGLEGNGDQRSVIGPLYAADLLGGSLGSLAGGLVLIPLAGLPLSAFWMAPPALISLLLLK